MMNNNVNLSNDIVVGVRHVQRVTVRIRCYARRTVKDSVGPDAVLVTGFGALTGHRLHLTVRGNSSQQMIACIADEEISVTILGDSLWQEEL